MEIVFAVKKALKPNTKEERAKNIDELFSLSQDINRRLARKKINH